MLPIERAQVQLRYCAIRRMQRQHFGLDEKARPVNAPNRAVQDTQSLGHVLFGFGPFFECREFNVHRLSIAED